MASEKQEFRDSLDRLVEEIIARVEEVGLEQAGEEYWEKAKASLNEICERNAEYRRRHNIPIDEL